MFAPSKSPIVAKPSYALWLAYCNERNLPVVLKTQEAADLLFTSLNTLKKLDNGGLIHSTRLPHPPGKNVIKSTAPHRRFARADVLYFAFLHGNQVNIAPQERSLALAWFASCPRVI